MAVTADSVVVELIARTDGYTANINEAASATQRGMSRIEQSAISAERQIVRSSGAIANAQRNLGRQISDIGVGLSGGQSPFLIIAQQAPQVADALADTGGRAARVAAFFAGPWGAALLAAGSALGVLLGKALETGDTIESLTKKLEDNAIKARMAEAAEAIFERSLYGAAAASAELNKKLVEQNKSQLQVAQSALAAAQALRQQGIQNARNALLEAQRAEAQAKSVQDRLNAPLAQAADGGAGAAAGVIAERQLADARNRVKVATQGLAAAEKAVVEASVPILKLQAAEAADATAAATGRHERAVNKLTGAYREAQAAAAKLPGAAGNAARAAAVATFRAGVANADRTLASEKDAIREANKKGPSAETLARRAEAARIREVRNNEAFNNELEQLNAQIIAAQRERANTADELAVFDRDAIEAEFRKRQAGIAADLSAKRYSAAEAAELDAKNEAVRLARLRNVEVERQLRTIREQAERDILTLNIAQEEAQGAANIAETRREREAIERELISLKYQEREIQLKALRRAADVRNDTDTVNDINEQLASLPRQRANDERAVTIRNRGAYEQYRRNLENEDFLADSVDAVKINAIEELTDQLTDATTAALGLKGAFGDIVGQLIRIGIQRKLIGPIADQLFGKSDGSTSGSLGSIFSAIAGAVKKGPGRASGGYMAPYSVAQVNEGRGSGVELLRMGPQGGTVIPIGKNAAAPRGSGGTTVLQTIAVDARGAVMNDAFARDILARADQGARQIVNSNNGTIRRSLPGAQARFNQLGTT